ncbi:MAG: hypothetical protein JJE55_06390 [Flavobacteriaceae bacterium]|nr:hypothetical protein [Flavobacteriaceae bacterium]
MQVLKKAINHNSQNKPNKTKKEVGINLKNIIMPKFIIAKVTVRWGGGRSEEIKDVELITPFTPANDNRTKELLLQKFGCQSIGGVYTPVKKIG